MRTGKSVCILTIIILAGVFASSRVTIDAKGASTYNVAIVSYHFRLQNINITTGTNVVWTFWINGTDSGDVHTVTSDNQTQSGAGIFQSVLMHAGQTFTYIFYSPGKYPYHCSVHPTMTGLVNVTGPALNPPSSGSSYLPLYVGLSAIVAAVVIGGVAFYFRKSHRAGKIRP